MMAEDEKMRTLEVWEIEWKVFLEFIVARHKKPVRSQLIPRGVDYQNVVFCLRFLQN
jgi:hypothetical protein